MQSTLCAQQPLTVEGDVGSGALLESSSIASARAPLRPAVPSLPLKECEVDGKLLRGEARADMTLSRKRKQEDSMLPVAMGSKDPYVEVSPEPCTSFRHKRLDNYGCSAKMETSKQEAFVGKKGRQDTSQPDIHWNELGRVSLGDGNAEREEQVLSLLSEKGKVFGEEKRDDQKEVDGGAHTEPLMATKEEDSNESVHAISQDSRNDDRCKVCTRVRMGVEIPIYACYAPVSVSS